MTVVTTGSEEVVFDGSELPDRPVLTPRAARALLAILHTATADAVDLKPNNDSSLIGLQ